MAAQVSHVEEFGPDEGLEAGTCRSETLVLLMGHGRPAPVQEYQVEVTYDGVHHIFETTSYSSCLLDLCVSGNYLSPLDSAPQDSYCGFQAPPRW
ncbi:hypothetical protein E4U56_007362 [Claviceps arundinis]|uniref:Uncharacterized protein n=1 Tax=Claviceps arundinis TaxID=1623583 RepID=A0A9P7N1M0_9HYPO|nr:hypothetical protein E4U56_007362 [Claviceps arundinis]